MCRLSWNLGASTSWNPQGLSRPVMGLLYSIFVLTLLSVHSEMYKYDVSINLWDDHWCLHIGNVCFLFSLSLFLSYSKCFDILNLHIPLGFFFNVLLTVCLDIIVYRKTNLMHNLFSVYFVNLNIFRAYLDPSSGGTTVYIQQLVLIILFWWPGPRHSSKKNDQYQLLYTYSCTAWWWA